MNIKRIVHEVVDTTWDEQAPMSPSPVWKVGDRVALPSGSLGVVQSVRLADANDVAKGGFGFKVGVPVADVKWDSGGTGTYMARSLMSEQDFIDEKKTAKAYNAEFGSKGDWSFDKKTLKRIGSKVGL